MYIENRITKNGGELVTFYLDQLDDGVCFKDGEDVYMVCNTLIDREEHLVPVINLETGLLIFLDKNTKVVPLFGKCFIYLPDNPNAYKKKEEEEPEPVENKIKE